MSFIKTTMLGAEEKSSSFFIAHELSV